MTATFGMGVAALIIEITVHELGHLIGGLVSGYRFVRITVCGLGVLKNEKSISLYVDLKTPGQCIMASEELQLNPGLLIAGGSIANIVTGTLAGVMFFIALFFHLFFYLLPLFVSLSAFGIALGVVNLCEDDNLCDGVTLREVRESEEKREAYNRLMLIEKERSCGREWDELPEWTIKKELDLLEKNAVYDEPSSIIIEIMLCCYRYMLNNSDKSFDNLLKQGALLEKIRSTDCERWFEVEIELEKKALEKLKIKALRSNDKV